MNPVRNPRRLTPLLVVVTMVASLGLSACDPVGSGWAAKVNGVTISQKTLNDDMKAELIGARKPGISKLKPTDLVGAGAGTYNQATFIDKLNDRIDYQLLGDELARRHFAVNDDDRKAARRSLCDTTEDSPGSDATLTPEQIKTPCLDPYPPAYQAFKLAFSARIHAYARAVGAISTGAKSDAEYLAEAQQTFDQINTQNPTALDEICFEAAQVADTATANTVKAAVQAGTSLQAAATAKSGEYAPEKCNLASASPSELAGLAAGAIVGPIDNAGKSVLARVTRVFRAKFDDVKAEIITELQTRDSQSQTATPAGAIDAVKFGPAVHKLLVSGHVKIEPRYGTWDPVTGHPVPPPSPKGLEPTTTTTSPLPAGSSGSQGATGP